VKALEITPIASMLGKVMRSVQRAERDGDDALVFAGEDGITWTFLHYQSCCEHVRIEDIAGDLADLVGAPMLVAEESSSNNHDDPVESDDHSRTWTFYRFATVKGTVTVRWLGESNGYYSERVSLDMRDPSGELQL
jgi:hypothetical protein